MMTSTRKVAANRRNARRSTGPRTRTGKSQSKQNARRHGLASIPVLGPEQSIEIKQFAIAISGQNADPTRLYFATLAAEAEIRLLQVQTVQASTLALALRSASPDGAAKSEPKPSADELAALLENLSRLQRYEQRAFVLRNRLFSLL